MKTLKQVIMGNVVEESDRGGTAAEVQEGK